MKAKGIITFLFFAFFCGFSFYQGYGTGKKKAAKDANQDTVVITRTIRSIMPSPDRSRIIGKIGVPVPRFRFSSIKENNAKIDTVTIHDTIFIESEQKEYQSENYRAWVSGYQPSLDSIEVYPKTKIITRTKKRKWSIGIYGGYGIGNNGLSPEIGVGFTYSLF